MVLSLKRTVTNMVAVVLVRIIMAMRLDIYTITYAILRTFIAT